MQDRPFFENVVVLTGASAGIGKELAYQLARQGAWLVLAARNREQLEEVSARCRELGGRSLAVACDVGVQSDCEALVQAAVAEHGRIDTLVNNAGITMWGRFDELKDLSVLERLMRVNYLGSAWCTAYALPHLKKSRGRLVGVSSLAGRTGAPTRSGYAATKHAQVGFFDSLRIELEPDGVSVTMIYPGFVATEIRKRAMDGEGRPLGESPIREAEVMTAEECARQMLAAMAGRRRELLMTGRGKLLPWMKLIAPRLVERLTRSMLERGH